MRTLPKISTSSFACLPVLALLTGCAGLSSSHADPAPVADCLTPGPVQTRVLADKASGFTPTEARPAAQIARDLAGCLGARDPVIRDQVAYEGLTQLLRSQALTDNDMRALKDQFLIDLSGDDPDGVLRPFAALLLSEIIRADRVAPYLNDEDRSAILDAGIAYFKQLDDYRGFDPVDGWRHGIAHTADLFMQVSLNLAFDQKDHLKILDALALQITTTNHAYTHGEGERMARPVLFIARAGTLSDTMWIDWFAKLSDPAPLSDWGAAFSSAEGLTRLHNLKYTLYPLALSGRQPDDKPPLLPGLEEALARLP